MRILYIAGNPADEVDIQVDEELSLLQEKLDHTNTAEPLEIRVYSKVRFDDLLDIIVRTAPDIIHFSAHGGEEGISLATSKEDKAVLDGKALAKLLHGRRVRPKLIVINACSSTAMATDLVGAAGFVVGMDAEITNIGARVFAANLYQRLANGDSIANAFDASAALLEVMDGRHVHAELFPSDGRELAKQTFVGDPFRILASFPAVDRWLKSGHTAPHKGFDPDYPKVEFGLCGVPAATRQAMLFTDDASIQPKGKETLFESRGWFIEAPPARGEIWFDDSYPYFGDLEWYAAVTTGDSKIHSCSSSLVDALERYYLLEARCGALPPEIGEVVNEALANLRANDGTRLRRR